MPKDHNITFTEECPVCKQKTLVYSSWYYHATNVDPVDCGLELMEQKCACKISDDLLENLELKIMEG